MHIVVPVVIRLYLIRGHIRILKVTEKDFVNTWRKVFPYETDCSLFLIFRNVETNSTKETKGLQIFNVITMDIFG